MSLAGAATLTFLGLFEGYAFYRCGMYAPVVLESQMRFQKFIVMKVFFSAVGSSMIAQSIMSKTNSQEFEVSRYYKNMTVGFQRNVGGCFLLGVGMAIAGSGPTLIPTQLVGVQNGWMLLAGCIGGGLVYGLLEQAMGLAPVCKSKEPLTLDEKFKKPYSSIAVPMGAALLAATLGLEVLFPQARDAADLNVGPIPTLLPILAGCVVGINQIPLRFLQKSGQGGSTSIMRIVSTLTLNKISPGTAVTGLQSLYQFFYVYLGGILGAYLAMSQAGPSARQAVLFSPQRTLFGSALMIIGARIAGGCTCGHGITGFSELSVNSIAAAMAIFAGGILTALVAL